MLTFLLGEHAKIRRFGQEKTTRITRFPCEVYETLSTLV